MANYQATTLSGTAYTRANQVVIANPLDGVKAISFMEEQVVNLGDEQLIRPQGGIQEPFTAENIDTEFPLLNPLDSTPVGLSMTYEQVYVALHSLYFHVASKRDAAVAQAKADAEAKAAADAAAKLAEATPAE